MTRGDHPSDAGCPISRDGGAGSAASQRRGARRNNVRVSKLPSTVFCFGGSDGLACWLRGSNRGRSPQQPSKSASRLSEPQDAVDRPPEQLEEPGLRHDVEPETALLRPVCYEAVAFPSQQIHKGLELIWFAHGRVEGPMSVPAQTRGAGPCRSHLENVAMARGRP